MRLAIILLFIFVGIAVVLTCSAVGNGNGGKHVKEIDVQEVKHSETQAAANITKAPNVTTTTTTTARGKQIDNRFCNKNIDLRRGTLSKNQNSYKPQNCTFKRYRTANDWNKCMKGKSIVMIGDSLLREVAARLNISNIRKDGSTNTFLYLMLADHRDWKLHYISKPAIAVPANDFTNQVFYKPYSRMIIKEADYIIIANGMWDMGGYHCAVDTYFWHLKAFITLLQRLKKKSAKLMAWGIRYINPDICVPEAGRYCKPCNKPEKVVLYREIMRNTAGCLGVPFIETHHLTWNSSLSFDGAHYHAPVVQNEVDLLGNILCGPTPMEPMPSVCVDEKQMLNKWMSNPILNTNHGCPGTDLTQTCRYHGTCKKYPTWKECRRKGIPFKVPNPKDALVARSATQTFGLNFIKSNLTFL